MLRRSDTDKLPSLNSKFLYYRDRTMQFSQDDCNTHEDILPLDQTKEHVLRNIRTSVTTRLGDCHKQIQSLIKLNYNFNKILNEWAPRKKKYVREN